MTPAVRALLHLGTFVVGCIVGSLATVAIVTGRLGDNPLGVQRPPFSPTAPAMQDPLSNTAAAVPDPSETPTVPAEATNTPPARTATAIARATAVALTAANATATAKTIESETPWSYDEMPDPMGRGTIYFATTRSTSPIEFGFPYAGAQYPELILRKRHDGVDVMFGISRGQFLCSKPACVVNVRFGTGEIVPYYVNEPDDRSTTTLFIQAAASFIARLKRADTVTIEAKFYREGARAISFDTRWLQWKHSK